MVRVSRGLTICLLAALLSACGGGGGGGGNRSDNDEPPAPAPPAPPPPPPVTAFTLSGVLAAANSQSVDSDTNDPTRIAVSNDLPAIAQTVGNPLTLGGYVNQRGAGAEGRSQVSGDIDDYFRVELLEGQTISMLVADFGTADADLYLFDEQENIVDFSIDTGDIESLVVPEDGTYFINAFAFAGATNYIIAIGSPGATPQFSANHHSIVPWEAVVKYRDNANDERDERVTRTARRLGMEQRGGGRGRARLMALRSMQREAIERRRRLGTASAKQSAIQDPDLLARWETLLAIKSLRRDPAVRSAHPNYRVSALAEPNDERFPLQWHYPLIGLPDAWETTTGSANVIVAVVDTGVLAGHPDLVGQWVDGYDFVRDADAARDGDGIDPDPSDPGEGIIAGLTGFHGTHVSGTVAARGNNNIGVAGTAYGSRIMPMRALGADGSGTTYDVDQAIRYAAGLENDSGTLPQKPADIINLSIGGGPFIRETQDLFEEVRAAGIMIVAAAGNEASSAPSYPASYDGVISVSAVDAQRRLAGYSNTGTNIDIAAPGGDSSVDLNGDGFPDGVLSTGGSFNGSRVNFAYPFFNGTSMAAPHVSGVLALMKSVNPTLTPADIDALLVSGRMTDDIGRSGRDNEFGHGLVNAQKSVLAALEESGQSPADNPRLVASAASLNFGATTSTLSLALNNGGKGELNIQGISVSQPWLSVNPIDIEQPSRLGEYEIAIDRDGLDTGIYSGQINAQSSVNNLAISVLMSVGTIDGSADVGVVYMLLYDPVTEEAVAQFASGGDNGEYAFVFPDVAAGSYQIFAGSDADNDLLICDAGEACGAWLTTDRPSMIEVNGDRDDLDFPVEFQIVLPRTTAESAVDKSNSEMPTGIARKAESRENLAN